MVAYVLGVDIIVKTNDIVTSSGEVDTEVQFTEQVRLQTQDSKDNECTGDAISNLTSCYEIEVDILEEVLHQRSGEAQLLGIVTLCIVLEQQTGDEHSREERGDDTDHVGNSEALDRTSTEDSQDGTSEEGRYVRVYDSADSPLETVFNSLTHSLATTEFLTDTLVDEHVCIHRTTHGQHDTCDTRKGQDGTERREDTYQQEDVANQCSIRNQTRNPTIVEDHVDQDEDEAQGK